MQTVTVDIIDDKAIKLLEDLEALKIIRVHKDNDLPTRWTNPVAKYKGKMTKQPLTEVEEQLKELRESWE